MSAESVKEVNLKRRKVLVGISEAYTNDKIINCFKYRNDYEVFTYDCNRNYDNEVYDLYWLEYEDLDFEQFTRNNKVLINSYCIRKGLIRKAQLAFYLRKYMSKKPNSMLPKYIPETHILELDYLDYLDEALNDIFEVELALKNNLEIIEKGSSKTKKFILKSSMTNKGAEILLFDTKAQLEGFFEKRIAESEDECLDLREWVVQEYIDEPLLLNKYKNRKFHLRVYIVAVGNLKVYVYKDILALFSSESYSLNNDLNTEDINENMRSHITNTCFQLDNYEKCSPEWERIEQDCVKRFWDINFCDDQQENTKKQELIFKQIKDCVGELFQCFTCEPTVFQPLDNAFELYGLDFLVDKNYNCYFLEANAFPDFKQTGNNLNNLIDCLFYETIAIACDSFFSISKVCDPNNMFLVYDKYLIEKK